MTILTRPPYRIDTPYLTAIVRAHKCRTTSASLYSASYVRWQHGTVRIRPLLSAGRAAIDRYLLPAGPTAANLHQRVCCYGPMLGHRDGQTDRRTDRQTDRQTDGQISYRFIDPAPRTMQTVLTIYKCNILNMPNKIQNTDKTLSTAVQSYEKNWIQKIEYKNMQQVNHCVCT